jgi:hypothetical protein
MENKIRDLTTLSNDEIVSIVDLLVNCSRLRVDGVPLMESGDMSYRKIEAKIADAHDGIIIRVTYSEFLEGDKDVVAFIIEDGGDDVFILPVNRAKFIKEYVDTIGVNVDFSSIDQQLKKTYMYFAETLQLWNLGDLELAVNELLKEDEWCVIDQQIADF